MRERVHTKIQAQQEASAGLSTLFKPTEDLAATQVSAPAQENVFVSASYAGHDFSQIPVYSSGRPATQTRHKPDQPEGAYEQAADRRGEYIVPVADPTIQAQDSNVSAPAVSLAVNDVLRSPGQPLDASTRALMEPRFQHDFSKVRIHADERASASARAVHALAYTVGNDIVFNNGQYSPTTLVGEQLLAHELTHSVQQSAIPREKHTTISVPAIMNSARDAAEQESGTGIDARGIPHQ